MCLCIVSVYLQELYLYIRRHLHLKCLKHTSGERHTLSGFAQFQCYWKHAARVSCTSQWLGQ